MGFVWNTFLVISSGHESCPWLSFINNTFVILCCKIDIMKCDIWFYSSIFDCGPSHINPYLTSCQSFTLLQPMSLKGGKCFYSPYLFDVFYKSYFNTDSLLKTCCLKNVLEICLFHSCYRRADDRLYLDWQIKWQTDCCGIACINSVKHSSKQGGCTQMSVGNASYSKPSINSSKILTRRVGLSKISDRHCSHLLRVCVYAQVPVLGNIPCQCLSVVADYINKQVDILKHT